MRCCPIEQLCLDGDPTYFSGVLYWKSVTIRGMPGNLSY